METLYPKISIITPSFNQAPYLEATIKSVLNQQYPNLEYIIIDGGSTDGSLEIIQRYAPQLAYWVSEKDEGQYFAINKGLNLATGEIMAWINSDDMFHYRSLFTMASIYQAHPEIEWLMGYPSYYTNDGECFTDAYATIPFWSRYRYYAGDYKYIQQESVSWRSSLWVRSGSYIDCSYKYAADMELWARFFRYAQLDVTPHLLSGFRVRDDNQASFNYKHEYTLEAKHILAEERKRLSVVQICFLVLHFISYTSLRCLIYIYRFLLKTHIWLFGNRKPLPVRSR